MITLKVSDVITNDESIPPILYKYRNWEDRKHQRIITQQEVFLAAPSTFEDEFDCRNPIRYDLLSKEQILEKYYHDSQDINHAFSESEHQAFATHWAQNSPLHNNEYIKKRNQIDFKGFNERIGVLCLTGNPTNADMWHKYSRNSREFAVGFRSDILLKTIGGAGPVTYETPLPIIMPTPWNSIEEQIVKQIYWKMKRWEFEDEYRTLTFGAAPLTIADRILKVPVEAYEEIVFGALSSPRKREKIAMAAKEMMPLVKFKMIESDQATGKLTMTSL